MTAVALPEAPALTDLLGRGEEPMCCWGPAGGVVGWGVAARTDAATWDEALAGFAAVARAGEPWPVGLVTLPFDAGRTAVPATVVVPREALVVRDGSAWHVVVEGEPGALPRPRAVADPSLVVADDEDARGAAYRAAVAGALARIAAGEAEKLVIATSLRFAGSVAPADVALALAQRHPTAWVYCVDGLVGASPEMLLRRRGAEVASRVLAGTVDRRLPDAEALAHELFRAGSKNHREHLLAVESAREALGVLGSGVTASEPFELLLPHVIHLASDVTARVDPALPLLDVLGRLHPTAAVGGVPRAGAQAQLAELEGFDRGRFAGPVGMLGPDGFAELAIALRGGQADAEGITLYAGAGIVAGSDPDDEWREVSTKLRPMRDVLGA